MRTSLHAPLFRLLTQVLTWWHCFARWRRLGRLGWTWVGGMLLPGGVGAAPLTLAVADVPHAAPVLVAEAAGFFAAEGLALRLVHCANGRLCLDQLLSGQAQLATTADLPIAVAAFRDKDFQIAATLANSRSDTALVLRRDLGLRSPADLKGRRVGVIKGTGAQYFADSLLLFHGLRPSDVTWVPLDPAQPETPLLRGDVDAAALYEPWTGRALQALGPAGQRMASPLHYSLSFNLVSLPAERGVSDVALRQILAALARALRWMHEDPAAARASLERQPRIAHAAQGWDHFDYRLQLTQSLVTTLEDQARWAQREGLAARSAALPDFLERVRAEPLRRLDPRAVRLLQ